MKNKPLRHKTQNVFKFQSFSERISSIDIDVFHKVKHPYEEDEEEGCTHFSQCYDKWIDLNRTAGFLKLRSNLMQNVKTLPQLMAQKDEIVALLLENAKDFDSFSLQPTLELLTALARDLRKEFYPYFIPVFETCVTLLDKQDSDVVEWSFTCLAHLFKYLWQCIVKRMDAVLRHLLPLLRSSKPAYVNDFAAESFAFVIRKVKDKESFLKLILRDLNEYPNAVDGFGKLLFEAMKSVGRQFHSSAQEFFLVILRYFPRISGCKDLFFKIISRVLSLVAAFLNQLTDVKPICTSLFKALEEYFVTWMKNGGDSRDLEYCLKLTEFALLKIPCEKAAASLEIRRLWDICSKMIGREEWRGDLKLQLVTNNLVISLLSSQVYATYNDISGVLSRIIDRTGDESTAVDFVGKLVRVVSYKNFAVKRFLIRCEEKVTKNGGQIPDISRSFLAEFLAENEEEGTFVFQEIGKDLTFFSNALLKTMVLTEPLVMRNAEDAACSVIILSKLQAVRKDYQSLLADLSRFVRNYMKQHCADVSRSSIAAYLMWLCARYTEGNDFNDVLTAALEFVDNVDYSCCLKTAHLCLERGASLNTGQDVVPKLIRNLASPFHRTRWICLKILRQLLLEEGILEEMCGVEDIIPSVGNYRDKLQLLRRLEGESMRVRSSSVTLRGWEMVANFLLGNLYANFQLLWEPLQRLIAGHASCNPAFWPVFERELRGCANRNGDELRENIQISFKYEFIERDFYVANGVDDRPDFSNYRHMLWNVLSEFADCNCVDRECISDLFFCFYRDEYAVVSGESLKYCDILKCEGNNDVLEEDDGAADEEVFDKEKFSKELKNKTKLLIAHLKVICTAKWGRILCGREELAKIYWNLIRDQNGDVQKNALECLLKGKRKSQPPYKANLLALIDEGTFKHELIEFFGHEEKGVQPEYRSEVMPIVIGILYGKMKSTRGARGGARRQHREQIFRFLTACEERHSTSFMEMAFSCLNVFVKGGRVTQTEDVAEGGEDVLGLVRSVEMDLSAFLSPKKVLNCVTMLAEMQHQCGALLRPSGLRLALRVILIVGTLARNVNRLKAVVHAKYDGIFSKMRVAAFDCLTHFFAAFERYPWSERELEAVFEVFVWPWIEKLPGESLQRPAPLMRLFIAWSKVPKYFALLGKCEDGMCAISALTTILIAGKADPVVRNTVLDAIERVLTLEDVADEKDTTALATLTDENRQLLMIPYAQCVLNYLREKCDRKGDLCQRDASILLRLSSYNLGESESESLLSLLLPMLAKKGDNEEEGELLLNVARNLFRNLTTGDLGEYYVRQLAPLLKIVRYPGIRRNLCSLVEYVASKTRNGDWFDASVLMDLNAFDRKWIDQPDYDRRADAFKRIISRLEGGSLSVTMGVCIAYNCFYDMAWQKDMGLKANASHCLRKICHPVLCRGSGDNDTNYALNTVLFPSIRDGIKGSNEEFKQECVLLLGSLARECGDCHPVLKFLHILTNTDLELDFFENIEHLQSYKKVVALQQFCKVMKEETKYPPVQALMQFLSPLIRQFLCNVKYKGKNSLIDAAVEAVKILCLLSPWRHYESILRDYLRKMRGNLEFQKQMVRVVSAVLAAFHFDIGKGEVATKVRKKIEKRNGSGREKNEGEEGVTMTTTNDAERMEIPEEEIDIPAEAVPLVRRIHVLNKKEATRVAWDIVRNLLPGLNKAFLEHGEMNRKYDKNSEIDAEEVEMLTIPVATAIVQLLKRLPPPLLDDNIGKIFTKLCTYLKSRLQSVRLVARETMQAILAVVGCGYLRPLLSEMTALLTRGFQIHVCVFTSHAILEGAKGMMEPRFMDPCVHSILQICTLDLFGNLSEEKEVDKIRGKVPEARGNKSFNMLRLVAEFVGESHLLDVVEPLKEALFGTLSNKVVGKVRRALEHVVFGLVRNRHLSLECLLVFAYGAASQSIRDLFPADDEMRGGKDAGPNHFLEAPKLDSCIIPTDPRKADKTAKRRTCVKTNAHVFIEFGLHLLQFSMKKEALKGSFFKGHLDPFVNITMECLKEQRHVKLTTLALHCLAWLLKRGDLPSLRENTQRVTKLLFNILHKYAGAVGLTPGDNWDMVRAAFKAISVLVRDVKYHKITEQQLRMLVLYVEEDLSDYARQGGAFSVLSAVLSRKHVCPEFHEVMKKVAKLSVTSESEAVRAQARNAFFTYLTKYPLGKQLEDHVAFYVAQLDYELPSGRMSALEMLSASIKFFPESVLEEQCFLMLIGLSLAMTNDGESGCRKAATKAAVVMLKRLEKREISKKLFELTVGWLKDAESCTKRVGLLLMSCWVDAEEERFDRRLPTLSGIITDVLTGGEGPGHGVKLATEWNNDNDEGVSAENDLRTFHALRLILKIFEKGNVLRKENNKKDKSLVPWVRFTGAYCQSLLHHQHVWLRLCSCQILGKILQAADAEGMKISSKGYVSPSTNNFLCDHGESVVERLKSLCLDFCDQLFTHEDSQELTSQAMKNLIFMAAFLKDGPKGKISLSWLLGKLRRKIGVEISLAPQSYTIRTAVFNWLAALAVKLDSEELAPALENALHPLVRELTTTDEAGQPVRRIAKQAVKYYKQKVPADRYAAIVTKIQNELNAKRAERKIRLAQQMVTDPERAAKRKITTQLKKKEKKKLKLQKLRKGGSKRKSRDEDDGQMMDE